MTYKKLYITVSSSLVVLVITVYFTNYDTAKKICDCRPINIVGIYMDFTYI